MSAVLRRTMYSLEDVLAHNCPKDVKDTEQGQYALHEIELHCNWFIAITLKGVIIESAIYGLETDKKKDFVEKKWRVIS